MAHSILPSQVVAKAECNYSISSSKGNPNILLFGLRRTKDSELY